MKNTISKRDWETISAYLDGQLSPQKQTRLESRIQQDQQLEMAFEELRDTRHMLRNAPRLRAPRSFMLTPEMAGQPHRLPNLAPFFGWVSAVAGFLFVLFLVGDLFTTGGAIPTALNNFPQQQVEFVAPKGSVAEDEEAAQLPSDTAAMEATAELAAGVPFTENPAGEEALEAVAIPAEEAATRQIEPVETTETEQPVTEEVAAEIQQVATATQENPDTGMALDVLPAEEPTNTAEVVETETTEVVVVEEVAATEEPHEPREDSGELLQVASITETLPTETVFIEESETLPVEEIQPAAEEVQPAEKVAPTAILAQSDSESQAAEMAIPEPTHQSDWGSETTDKTDDYVIGAEVILGLLALGTGFAWFYTRRRGG